LRALQQHGDSLSFDLTDNGVMHDAVLYALEVLPVFYSALSYGNGMLMVCHWEKFLEDMRERFGIDDKVTDAIVHLD
jgi:hypothetical protein